MGPGNPTLMKILTGVHSPDAGEILYKGAPLVLKNTGILSSGLASSFKVQSVSQSFSNGKIFLGKELTSKGTGLFSYRKTREEAREFFHRLKFDIDLILRSEIGSGRTADDRNCESPVL